MARARTFFAYIKKISQEFDTWQTAIRICEERCLYQGNTDAFVLVPNCSRYWRADPFVYKHKGVNYLFAEMFDRKTKKGVIGVATLKNGRCGKFRVCLDLPHHLSYPCVFEKDGQIYMIPECNQSKEISLYRADRFPIKWKKIKTIHQKEAVDTTPLFDTDGRVRGYFTSLYEPVKGGNDNLYYFEEGQKEQVIYKNNTTCRMAGHFIEGEKLIRPTQDDSFGYGDALIFHEIDNLNPTSYQEHELLRVLPPGKQCKGNEIAVSLKNNKKNLIYTGIHTYNKSEDYEVIDLRINNQPNLYVLWDNRHKLLHKFMKRFS